MGGIICGAQREIEILKPVVKYYGAVMAPLIAWLLIRGIRTLGVRIERQCENAMHLAGYLGSHPKVSRVFYAGLENNPQFALNKNQFNGFSGMLAFEVKGGWPAAKKVMEHLQDSVYGQRGHFLNCTRPPHPMYICRHRNGRRSVSVMDYYAYRLELNMLQILSKI
jgi:cystathionine beta-lyase/cystathionine gamma-synthase